MGVIGRRFVSGDVEVLVEPLDRGEGKQRAAEIEAEGPLLQRLIGHPCELCHEPSGRPYLRDCSLPISISHTKGYICAAKGKAESIGVDIEYPGDRVLRVREKFVSPAEVGVLMSAGLDELHACLVLWCAKEAAYKKCGMSGVDFREHFVLKEASGDRLSLSVEREDNPFGTLKLSFFVCEDYVLAFG